MQLLNSMCFVGKEYSTFFKRDKNQNVVILSFPRDIVVFYLGEQT
jgi:hypothetical protein